MARKHQGHKVTYKKKTSAKKNRRKNQSVYKVKGGYRLTKAKKR